MFAGPQTPVGSTVFYRVPFHRSRYCAEGLQQTLERVWERMGQLSVTSAREKRVLRPRQEQRLKRLGQSGGVTPSELWAAPKVSKQGAMDLLRPRVKAELVNRVGTLRTGR